MNEVFFAKLQILIKDLNNDETKRCEPNFPVDMMFPGPLGSVLLRSDDRVYLYDLQQKKSFAELTVTGVKAVYWANDFSNVALITKDSKKQLEKKA